MSWVRENGFVRMLSMPYTRVSHIMCNISEKAHVNMLVSATEYKGIFKKLITVAKYGPYKQVLMDVTERLISDECVNALPLTLRLHGECSIYPVPMHPHKKKYRGFNQAEKIADVLSRKTGLPIMRNQLLKTIDTSPQASLSRLQRQRK